MLQRAVGGGRREPVDRGGGGDLERQRPGQMLPRLTEVQADYGTCPEMVLADAGYCKKADLASLEERGVDAYVALGREGNKAVAVNAKAYPARARMAAKLATPEGRARYAKRKWLSEAPNGWIKQALGFRRFSVRGLGGELGDPPAVVRPP